MHLHMLQKYIVTCIVRKDIAREAISNIRKLLYIHVGHKNAFLAQKKVSPVVNSNSLVE